MGSLDKKSQEALFTKVTQCRKFNIAAYQLVERDISDIKKLSSEEVNTIANNTSHQIRLKKVVEEV